MGLNTYVNLHMHVSHATLRVLPHDGQEMSLVRFSWIYSNYEKVKVLPLKTFTAG